MFSPVVARAEALVQTIVTDPLSGVALEGYDPVSYFTEAEPVPGVPDYEYVWQGVPWYFASPANRDVFIGNPTIYAPQFGGHCVMSLSRGFLSDGKPRLFVIEGMKLYLFYSLANREAFLAGGSRVIATANANWYPLSQGLTGVEQSFADAVIERGGADAAEPGAGAHATEEAHAEAGAHAEAEAEAHAADEAPAEAGAPAEAEAHAADEAPAEAGAHAQAETEAHAEAEAPADGNPASGH